MPDRFRKAAAWCWPVLVAAAIGPLVGCTISPWLDSLWFDLGWRRPVANWLLTHGFVWLASKWALIWIRLPSWMMLAVLGSIVGLLWPRRWLSLCTVLGLAFVSTPYLAGWWLGSDLIGAFGVWIAVYTVLWDLAGLPIVFLMSWSMGRFRRQPVPAGHCQHCGYDLTGNVSGICPECGNTAQGIRPPAVS